jgi:hypothetical protein
MNTKERTNRNHYIKEMMEKSEPRKRNKMALKLAKKFHISRTQVYNIIGEDAV